MICAKKCVKQERTEPGLIRTYRFQFVVRLHHREHGGHIERDRNRAQHAALPGRKDLAHQQERYRAEAHREADHEYHQTDDRYVAVVHVAHGRQMEGQPHERHGHAHHHTGHDEQRLSAGSVDHEQRQHIAGQLNDTDDNGGQVAVD